MEIPPDYFHFLSFLSIHRTEVQVSIFPAHHNDFYCGWSATERKLVGCCSSLLWHSLEGLSMELSLPDLWKWNILWNREKKSILFKSTSCIRQGNSSPCYLKRLFFSSPLISCSSSILYIFPTSISIILSLLYMNTSLHHHSQAEK